MLETDNYSADMPQKVINLIKLCVGTDTVEELETWQENCIKRGLYTTPEHVTRMKPRRWLEIIDGGSLYWVFKGYVLARQRIMHIETRTYSDDRNKCALILSKDIIRTHPVPKRPFQGWRYLEMKDCPPDLVPIKNRTDELPEDLELELRALGLFT